MSYSPECFRALLLYSQQVQPLAGAQTTTGMQRLKAPQTALPMPHDGLIDCLLSYLLHATHQGSRNPGTLSSRALSLHLERGEAGGVNRVQYTSNARQANITHL